jgi:hypothetical protein
MDGSANNMMYLPLDQLLKSGSGVRRFSTEMGNNMDSGSSTSSQDGGDSSIRPSRSQREAR